MEMWIIMSHSKIISSDAHGPKIADILVRKRERMNRFTLILSILFYYTVSQRIT